MLIKEYMPISDSLELEENNEILFAVTRLANRFVEDIAKQYVEPIARKAKDIRTMINIEAVRYRGEDFVSILAIDSTWTKPLVELVIGDLAVIATGYIVVAPAGIGSHGISYIGFRRSNLGDEPSFNRDIELDAKITEFYTAIKKMENSIDLVMLDGSLFFSTIPEFFNPMNISNFIEIKKNMTGVELASIASSVLVKMFRKAKKLNIPIVGVVKRVASRFLAPRLRDISSSEVLDIIVKTNDKFILSLVLQPGEYIVLGGYLDILSQYLSYIVNNFTGEKVRRAQKVLKIIEHCKYSDNILLRELCSYMEDTAIVFYKQIGDSIYPQATRLDIYPKTAINKIVNYAVYNSSQNSVPIPIDFIDRYIRLESSLIKKVYSILKTCVRDPGTLIALSPTNPQKYYLFE